jgi:hypothetical protein
MPVVTDGAAAHDSSQTVISPVFVQVTPLTVTISDQLKVPADAYAWLGFCIAECALPSPKSQSKVGVPEQLLGVAVAEKAAGTPAIAVPGPVAVHATEQTAHETVPPLGVTGT